MKIVFYGLIVIIGILAFLTAFFAQKSRKSQPALPTPSNLSSDSTPATSTPEVTASAAVSRLSSANERPSDPRDTYTIEKGDSLLVIAQKNGLTIEELTSANGISDPDKILSGQVLMIPTGNQISFTIDNTKSTNLQKFVDNGKYPWRLEAEETARSDNAGAFGLETTDNYILADKNLTEGEATVNVTKDGKTYQIKLVQPVTKGDKGIWAIASISVIS